MAKCIACDKGYSRLADLKRLHYKEHPDHAPDDWPMCEYCGEKHDNLGKHWAWNKEHIPTLTEEQHQIITGVLMGDGWIANNKYSSSKNCSLQIESITKKYLEYLNDKFGNLMTGVKIRSTAEESAKKTNKSGLTNSAKKENYSDIYVTRTRCVPEINQYREWYDSGKKVWPKDIELTPTVLKHLYCCDGSKHISDTRRPCAQISACNEYGNEEKLKRMFSDSGFSPRIHSTCRDFGVDESEELWKYMGDPLPGFEYKWPQ